MSWDAEWWMLPGPSRVLDGVLEEIYDGRVVILGVPPFVPVGLSRALRRRGRDGWRWIRIDAQSDREPLRQLWDGLPGGSGCSGSLRELAQTKGDGRILLIEDIVPQTWTAWRETLLQYAARSRDTSVEDRLRLLAIVASDCRCEWPKSEVCLVARCLDVACEALDMKLFISSLLDRSCFAGLLRELTISVLASVSLWDPETAIELAADAHRSAYDPVPGLLAVATRRGWTPETPVSWGDGTLCEFEGRRRTHSVLLAARGLHDELKRRVWRGQIGALLPAVEEARLDLLPEWSAYLRVPVKTEYGVITTIEDLEFGEIVAQLAAANAPPPLLKAARWLRDTRNRLAHGEALSHSHLGRGGAAMSRWPDNPIAVIRETNV